MGTEASDGRGLVASRGRGPNAAARLHELHGEPLELQAACRSAQGAWIACYTVGIKRPAAPFTPVHASQRSWPRMAEKEEEKPIKTLTAEDIRLLKTVSAAGRPRVPGGALSPVRAV